MQKKNLKPVSNNCASPDTLTVEPALALEQRIFWINNLILVSLCREGHIISIDTDRFIDWNINITLVCWTC